MILSAALQAELKNFWSFEGEPIFHRRVANFVFFARLEGRAVVLRLTEPIHRSREEIESELSWMSYLYSQKIQVVKPVVALDKSFVSVVKDSNQKEYYAAVFEKAPGAFLKDDEISNELIRNWGRFVGRMNYITKGYRPTAGILLRQDWDNDESLAMARRSFDKSDKLAYLRMHELLEWMASLEKNPDSYGLIHGDLHQGNFFVNQGRITAFDFDDSCYHWFAYDIVPPINSIYKNQDEGNFTIPKEEALDTFLEGYLSENKLDSIWIERVTFFDKFRAALTYHWAKTCLKEEVFDDKGIAWANEKLPKLLAALKDPLKLF
jgi:Ser/Thr protein kinase RdoA (MazF antagonist)